MNPVHPKGGEPHRRGHREACLVLALALGALAAPLAHAQRSSVWVDASGEGAGTRLATTLAVTGLRAGALDLDAWARIGVRLASPYDHGDLAVSDGPRALVGAGAAARRTTTFGQLGNVTLEGGASLASTPAPAVPAAARAWLGARGTIASVAISLALEAGNATPRVVDPVRPAPPDAAGQAALRALDDQRSRGAARTGDWDVGGRLGVVYRYERTRTLGVDAYARGLAGAPALGVGLDLRTLGVSDDVDAWMGVRLDRLALATSGSVGLGLYHAPRRGPTSWLRGWLGAGPAGVWPGVDGRWTTRALPGELSVSGAWRPWLAVQAWEAGVAYRHDVPGGDLHYQVGAEGGVTNGVRWTATLRWQRSW